MMTTTYKTTIPVDFAGIKQVTLSESLDVLEVHGKKSGKQAVRLSFPSGLDPHFIGLELTGEDQKGVMISVYDSHEQLIASGSCSILNPPQGCSIRRI